MGSAEKTVYLIWFLAKVMYTVNRLESTIKYTRCNIRTLKISNNKYIKNEINQIIALIWPYIVFTYVQINSEKIMFKFGNYFGISICLMILLFLFFCF